MVSDPSGIAINGGGTFQSPTPGDEYAISFYLAGWKTRPPLTKKILSILFIHVNFLPTSVLIHVIRG